MPVLTRENLTAFLARDWSKARLSKDRAIARHVQANGPSAAFRLAQALLDEVWPRIRDQKPQKMLGLLELRRKLDAAHAERLRLDGTSTAFPSPGARQLRR
jgi:hypothetical protein